MNQKMVFRTIAQIVKLEAALLLLPLFVSLYYQETAPLIAFSITIVATAAFGFLLTLLVKQGTTTTIFAKEGFVIVALSWLFLSAFGALPFFLSGEIPSYADAFFETVSGFTTTGASILTNIEALSKSLLFWRSFTHWIGGMGVIVMIVAILPATAGRPIHILRAEMPGPTMGKLVPKSGNTAKILYIIYLVLTLIEILFLLLGGMPLFDSIVHAFGTAGTGGFGIKATGLAGYNPYCQWVIAIFMALFGVNFNLYYLLLIRKFRSVLKSGELWLYIGIIVVSISVITCNIYPLYQNIGEALRLSAFQVSSIITTTGYATTDFNLWPGLSKCILLLLMFVGGCAGSTAGGLKVSRVLLLLKTIARELRHMLHPRSVGVIQMEGKRVDNPTINGTHAYLALYFLLLAALFLILCLEPFSLETNLSAAISCFNNIGPGFDIVGPMGNYAEYSVLSKIVLSLGMLLGRLELYPLLFALSPSTWRKK